MKLLRRFAFMAGLWVGAVLAGGIDPVQAVYCGDCPNIYASCQANVQNQATECQANCNQSHPNGSPEHESCSNTCTQQANAGWAACESGYSECLGTCDDGGGGGWWCDNSSECGSGGNCSGYTCPLTGQPMACSGNICCCTF
jgi:hypothetical protein